MRRQLNLLWVGACALVLGMGNTSLAEPAQAEAPKLERFEYSRMVMATQARLLFYAKNEELAKAAATSAFQELDRLDAMLSDWKEDSELSQMSLHAGGPAVPVSGEFLTLLDLACDVSRVSNGAFDPTMGSLTKLWRSCRERSSLPTPRELLDAQARTGVDQVFIDHEAGTLRLGTAEMELDLGGIAKGFACDRALGVLGDHGISQALVEIGGDFAAGDAPPGEDGWELAVACGEDDSLSPTFRVANRGVATSGDQAQFMEINGTRYSHLINPKTGLGATESNCATVIAPTGALADALASVASLPQQHELPRALAQFDARLVDLRPAESAAKHAGHAGEAHDESHGEHGEHGEHSSASTQQTPARPGASGPLSPGQTSPGEKMPGPKRGDLGALVPLFDGNTLKGWTTAGGRYDGNAIWTVEDNCLVGRTGPDNAGGLIYTEGKYSSFEFSMDVWIDYPFDSGIFTNMLPRDSGLKGFQLTLDYRPEGQVGAVYADGFLFQQPDGAAKWKRGEWNHVQLRQTGFDQRLRFWLNEELITDYSLPADATGYAPHGRIGLQVHGGGSEGEGNSVKFRRIRLRELALFDDSDLPLHNGPEGAFEFGDEAINMGWSNLLAGDSLEAFEMVGRDVYSLKDGTLSMPANADGGLLRTWEEFRDFRMRLDFVVPYMGNSGVYLRSARDETNPSFSGAEVQILDDEHWESVTGSTLEAWQFTGSLYGSVPAGDHGRLASNGQWNTFEMLLRGERIAVALNGFILYDVRTSEITPANGEPFSQRAKSGFVGVQTHGPAQARSDDVLAFRNWFLQKQ